MCSFMHGGSRTKRGKSHHHRSIIETFSYETEVNGEGWYYRVLCSEISFKITRNPWKSWKKSKIQNLNHLPSGEGHICRKNHCHFVKKYQISKKIFKKSQKYQKSWKSWKKSPKSGKAWKKSQKSKKSREKSQKSQKFWKKIL